MRQSIRALCYFKKLSSAAGVLCIELMFRFIRSSTDDVVFDE